MIAQIEGWRMRLFCGRPGSPPWPGGSEVAYRDAFAPYPQYTSFHITYKSFLCRRLGIIPLIWWSNVPPPIRCLFNLIPSQCASFSLCICVQRQK